MPVAAQPSLEPGRVYRTKDLARWGTNPSRLARRLVSEGVLEPLAQGLFLHPRRSRFGPVPPTDDVLMRAFLEDSPYLFTGPEQWNALGLGTTAVYPVRLVYNRKRSGEFILGGRKFLLRRIPFPQSPPQEWFVVDLLEHQDMAGLVTEDLLPRLVQALAEGRFEPDTLREMARAYGTHRTRRLLERAISQNLEGTDAVHP